MSGDLLCEADELLHRQVNPGFIDNKGRVSSQAFRPTPKDEGQLSVSLGSLTSPTAAYELYTTGYELASAGVWSVTVEECQQLGVSAFSEPLTKPVPDPAHGFVDFREKTGNQTEKISKRLASKARDRGCTYSPDGDDATGE